MGLVHVKQQPIASGISRSLSCLLAQRPSATGFPVRLRLCFSFVGLGDHPVLRFLWPTVGEIIMHWLPASYFNM